MDIVLYNNNSDDNTINKSLTLVDTMSGTLKESCSIENPSITVECSGMIPANYCYISEFSRYYFITEQTILSNNRTRLNLKVDVLESFKAGIGALSAIIDNSSSNNDKYLSSDIWKSKVKTKTDVVNFPSGLNENGSYILITAGG